SDAKLYRNLLIVFLLSGLWHGASWNFVLWGAYHGFFLVLERLFLLNLYRKIGKWFAIPLNFIIVVTGWVLFRNEDITYAFQAIVRMYSFEFFNAPFAVNNDFYFMCLLAFALSFFVLFPGGKKIQDAFYGENFVVRRRWLAVGCGVLLFYTALSFITALDFNPFIY